MSEHFHFLIMQTSGFIAEIPDELKADILKKTIRTIGLKPDFLIFDASHNGETLEDEGRSLHIGMEKLPKKVYAKLDDFRSVEALKENMGEYAPSSLNTQYVTTLMLAEEY